MSATFYTPLHEYAFCGMIAMKGGIVMESAYIVMHQRKPNAMELARRISKAFHLAGMKVCAETWLFELGKPETLFDGGLSDGCDLIVSVGGDGTLLRANAIALAHDLPILGINVGRVGFLTEIEMDELDEACIAIQHGEYTLEERMLLDVNVDGTSTLALNDVVISRGGYSRLIGIDAWVGDDPIGHFIADGLLVATPTGSTGYSLSAGGPIICPAVECMLLTPICAHSLQHRPVVTAPTQAITVRLSDDVKAMVSVDGREPAHFTSHQTLTVTRASRHSRFVRLHQRSFFSKIRVKLSEWSC